MTIDSKNPIVRKLRDTRKAAPAPANNRNWYLILPDIHQIPIGANGSDEAKRIAASVKLAGIECSARVKSVSIPTPAVETDKQISVNSYWYFAKGNDINEITLEIFELEDGLTLEYFTKWQSQIMNSDGTNNPPHFYKRNLKYVHMDTAHNEIIISTLSGFFPSSIQEIQADYESSEFTTYTITLTGDAISHEVFGEGNRDGIDVIRVRKSLKNAILDKVTNKINTAGREILDSLPF